MQENVRKPEIQSTKSISAKVKSSDGKEVIHKKVASNLTLL